MVGLAQLNFKFEPLVGGNRFPEGLVPLWIEDNDSSARSKTVLVWVKK